MHVRAAELIEALGLEPHPEGGWFREVYRSTARVDAGDGRPIRTAITTIYFLLAEGGHSRWHRLLSDEIWHWYEGAPLELITVEERDWTPSRTVLGPAGPGQTPAGIVPAGWWQAARSLGAYTLVGCSVGPGFEFDDFHMAADDPAVAAAFRERLPALAPLL